MGLRSLGALAALALFGTLLLAVSAAGATGETATKTYIVQMLQAPVLTYEGGVGLPATKPAKGKKIDTRSAAVERYAGHLQRAHDEALAEVGGAEKLYDYVYSLNGLAAKLTAAQARGDRDRRHADAHRLVLRARGRKEVPRARRLQRRVRADRTHAAERPHSLIGQ